MLHLPNELCFKLKSIEKHFLAWDQRKTCPVTRLWCREIQTKSLCTFVFIYGLCTCINRTWYNHGGSTKQNLILAEKNRFNISVRISLYLPHASAPFASLPLRDGRSRATSWREGLKLAGLTPLVFRKERDKDGWRIHGFLSFTRSLPNRRVLGE